MPLPRRKTYLEKLKQEIAIETRKTANVKKGIFDIEMPVVEPQKVKDYRVIDTAAGLIDYLKRCEETGLGGFDYETTISEEYRELCGRYKPIPEDPEFAGSEKEYVKAYKVWETDFLKAPLDPWKAEICTVSLSAAPHEARVLFINNKGFNKYKDNLGGTVKVRSGETPAQALERSRDERNRQEVFDILDKHFFRNKKITKIAVNLAFETKQTARLGKYILSPVADPLIMWVRCLQIVAPESIKDPKKPASGKGLKPMTKEVYGVEMTPFEEVLKEKGVQFFSEISADDPAAVEYSAEDADYAVQHYLYWRQIAKQIPKYDEWLHEIEMPFTRVIGMMEYWGLRWDDELAHVKRQEAENARDDALRQIEALGARYGLSFTLNKSAKTLPVKELLFNVLKVPVAKTSQKTGNVSLDEESLIDMKFMLEHKLQSLDEENLLLVDETYSSAKQIRKAELDGRADHPYKAAAIELIDLIQKVQTCTTLLSSHIDGRSKYVNPISGRIHSGYEQWTETGRLSSSKPNMQNIPRMDNDEFGIRNFHIASPGKVLFLIDFSGFELRLLSWRADDKVMQDIFIQDGDLHRKTAASATGKTEAEVTKVERAHAKPVNFGIAYCATEHALQKTFKTDYGIRKPLDECAKLISAVKVAYPNIAKFQREIVVGARDKGYVETIYGFKRLLPYINSTNNTYRKSDERKASNTPIQGSAADVMKRCQNWAYEALGSNEEFASRAALIAQVHDEQIFELDDDPNFVERFAKAIKAEMERPPLPGFPVPIVADASIAYRWGEKMSLEEYLKMERGEQGG